MKATEEELKMIVEFDASEGVDEGTNIYMSDDEIIDFAKQYHTKQLILHGVSNRRELLIDFCLKMEEKAMEYKHLVPSEEFIEKYLKGNL